MTKQYTKPQLLEVGNAIEITLFICRLCSRRDSPWFRRYWFSF